MRRARAGEADHDDRRGQLDVEDLGPAAHEVFHEQPRGEQPDRALVDREPAERAEPGVASTAAIIASRRGRKPGSPKSSQPAPRCRSPRRDRRPTSRGCASPRR